MRERPSDRTQRGYARNRRDSGIVMFGMKRRSNSPKARMR